MASYRVVKPPAKASTVGAVQVSTKSRENATITLRELGALGLPEELRKLLRIQARESNIIIRYEDLEAYYASHQHIIDLTVENDEDPWPPKRPIRPEKPSVIIDANSRTASKSHLESPNILPYIAIFLAHPHVRFLFRTPNSSHGPLLSTFANDIVFRNHECWKKWILDTSCVREVRVWWCENSVDIVLKSQSSWARDWACGVDIVEGECDEARRLKKALGLDGRKITDWKANVVVGGVEGEDT